MIYHDLDSHLLLEYVAILHRWRAGMSSILGSDLADRWSHVEAHMTSPERQIHIHLVFNELKWSNTTAN